MKKSSNTESNNLSFTQNQEINLEISLEDLIGSTLRRKKYFIIAFLSIFAIGYKMTLEKPTWKGEFQIVIQSKNDQKVPNVANVQNSALSSIIGIKGLSNDLKTEVKILESSSILNPIFNFVRDKKKLIDENKTLKYMNWKKNSLKIKLVEDTSVLNIEYFDKDKELILPVLNKISFEYQKYSKRDRLRSLNQSIDYLENQKKHLRDVSKKSINAFTKFSLENNLGDVSSLPLTGSINNSLLKTQNDPQLLESNFFSYDFNQKYATQLKEISNLESLILEKSSILKDESQIIIRLKDKLKSLKDSISKPSDVLIQYRNLKRKAVKDELMLISIEDQLAYFKLEKAKQKNPWELISTPTLMEDPVSPRKLRILALTLLLGTFLGISSSIIRDKNSRFVFNLYDFKNLIPFDFLDKIYLNTKNNFSKFINVLIKSNLVDNKNDILFLPILQTFPEELNNQVKNLNKIFKENNIKLSDDLLSISDENIIIIVKKGSSQRQEIEEYITTLKLISPRVIGWILLED